MTPRELVHEQIAHRETESVPYTLYFESQVEKQLDEHFGSPAWRNRLTQHIVRSNIAYLDNQAESRVVDRFGTVWKRDELPPIVLEPALKTPSFEGYTFPTAIELVDKDKIEPAKQLAAESSSFVAVGTGISLWKSFYLRGFEQTLMDCVAEEDFYIELLDRMKELTLEVIVECADIPADAIMFGDDWGGQRGVLIGPERWRKFFKPRYAEIFEAVHRQGKIAMMHSCGSVADIMPDIVEIGLDVLESVQAEAAGMNPYELKRKWGDKITFWGGLGSQSTVPFASPKELRKEIRRLRTEMSRGGGYILAPAKPIRRETPFENSLAVFEEFASTNGN